METTLTIEEYKAATIYKQKKVNSMNTIICVIEEMWEGCLSVLVYDEFGDGVWIEKFATSYDKAVVIADKLFAKACNMY